MTDRFDDWVKGLEARHLANLRFQEVSRALRALSSTYVERRAGISGGAALSGAGKRAAFALFYGPIHYLLVREIVSKLPGASTIKSMLVDLGCGTGAAGAAWAAGCRKKPTIIGIDRHPWAIHEASQTYGDFGLTSRTRMADIATAKLPTPAAVLAAFTLNELSEPARESMLPRLISAAGRGDAVLIVEPLAGFVAPWWPKWQSAVETSGGRADEWRVKTPLPDIVEKLDRAAGLNHRELTGRSLWLPPRDAPRPIREAD